MAIFPGKSDERSSRETVLITGCHGFVGQHVVRLFMEESNYELVLTAREPEALFAGIAKEPRIRGYHTLDITQRSAVRDVIGAAKPDVIVNCAGFVKVDDSETQRETAWRTNVTAVEHLAEAARKVDARIVHVSSDLVFDGLRAPFGELDTPHPINYYGRTKLASENVLRTSGIDHTIFRTSSIYGATTHANTNYALSVILSLEAREPVMAATDLINAPTLVDDLALAIVRATERKRLGNLSCGRPGNADAIRIRATHRRNVRAGFGSDSPDHHCGTSFERTLESRASPSKRPRLAKSADRSRSSDVERR